MTDEEQIDFWSWYHYYTEGGSQRRGQARMNALWKVRPDLYDTIHGTDADCFYVDERIKNFEATLRL